MFYNKTVLCIHNIAALIDSEDDKKEHHIDIFLRKILKPSNENNYSYNEI